MPPGPATAYTGAVLRKAWELSAPRFSWLDPTAVGLFSLGGIYLRKGLPGTAAEAMSYLWAALPVLLWWALVFAVNLVRAPYLLHEEARLRQPQMEPLKPTRIYVDASPLDLTAISTALTAAQANRATADYIGKWLPIAGKVLDVCEYSDTTVVTVEPDSGHEQRVMASLSFDGPDWRERIVIL